MDLNSLIEKYGPSVVAAAQKQVQVAIIQDLFWGVLGIGLIIATLILGGVAIAMNKKDSYGDWPVPAVVAFFTGVLGLLFTIFSFGEAWTFSQNPDWAVITLITRTIK